MTEQQPTAAIIRTAEQPEYLHPDHTLFFLRDVVTGETNPALSLHRGRIEPNGEIVSRRIERTDTIYILSGDALCNLAGKESRLGAGSCIVAPARANLSLKNCGEQPVELLIAVTPPLPQSKS
ncbi:MAG: cupin domain-containing protein [Deltaproteobacteria bacterium]|nr:cupin domain-containing protein [Deltaproteobacteria bacterium]